MHEALQELGDRFVQLARSRRSITGTYTCSNASATAPVGRHQAFVLQLRVRARHGVGSNPEIAGQLTYRRKSVAGPQFAAFYEIAKLIHDLLKRSEIRIDREKQLAQDAAADRRPR